MGLADRLQAEPENTSALSVLKKMSVEELMDIEATSVSRRPEKLSEAASAIQVITGEDIRRAGASSLPEALRLASNLQVAQIDSRQWAVSARGFNGTSANKLLVLMDGRSISTPLHAADPFGRFLDETVQGERASHRPIVVRRYRRVEEIADCHILFISRSESARLGEIFARLRGRSILTVGDAEGFALGGGMIRFLTENNRTRLRINVEAARAAHLAISSKLLRPVEIVVTGKN